MKRYLCLLVLLCFFVNLQAQERPQPLFIGDKLPDISIGNVLNHPDGKIDLADYRGRWLILDFFATWCSPCIAMFPKADALEESFAGKVRFLSVTYEKESEVTELFDKMDFLEGINPAIVVRDSLLRALFPHHSLPHYVWINPEGEVAAITGMDAVTEKNISAMIKNGSANLPVKRDEPTVDFDHLDDSLITLNRFVGEKSVYYTSTLTGYVEGVSSFIYSPKRRVLAMNMSLGSLYREAYGAGEIYFGSNRTFIEVNEVNKITTNLTGAACMAWRKNNAYCFEANVPVGARGNKYGIMQQALELYFPQYQVVVETREVKVLALVRTSDEDKIKSLGGKPDTDIKPYGATLRNRPLNHLMRHLIVKYLQLLPTPVVDRTGYEGKVDIILDADLSNVASLRQALQAYDLDLVERMEEIEVLVIRDSKREENVGNSISGL